MQINSHNTVGQTNSQKLNPAREARQQIANNSADAESIFGKLVSSLAKGSPQTTPTTSG
jgi:hypothetical protein